MAVFAGASIRLLYHPHNLSELLVLGIFFILILLAELWPISFPGSNKEFTMTMPVFVGSFLSQGPAGTVVVGALGMFIANVLIQRKRPLRWVFDMVSFNAASYVIAVALASVAYLMVGGRTLAQNGGITPHDMIIPLFVWVGVCTTANMILLTTMVALYYAESWRVQFVQNLGWYIPNYLVTGPSGILFALLYSQFREIGILLLVIPFLVGRKALNQYAVETDMYRETITTLGSYMQHYHPYTKGHLERVADLSDKIAREVYLPPQSLMLIRQAGLLHDIGKVGVNEEVLDKVGKLSDEDWSIIKQHPARGAEILSQLKYLERIVPWVRGHHERPDGRGYPDGLTNESIALEAAVIAVADAFDAMTGGPDEKDQRVYRVPLTIDQAIDQVRYGAGTQFDARVVKAFMRVMAKEGVDCG
ncbi:MAG: HD-GYP domain-containing protein [Armatimonadota bacterium]